MADISGKVIRKRNGVILSTTSPETTLKKFYVYLLVDPRNDHIFYVGKGTEDRVFQHNKEVMRGIVETEKQVIINEIVNSGNKEKRLIVARFDTEQEAFAVESVLIHWVYGKNNLTNDQSGHMVNYVRPQNNFDFLPGIDEPELDFSDREREKRERYEVKSYLNELKNIIEKKFDIVFDGINDKKDKHTYLYKIICGVMLSIVTHHNSRRSATVTVESISMSRADKESIIQLCENTKLEYRNGGRYARIKPGMNKSIDDILASFDEIYTEIIKYKKSITNQ